MRAWKRFLPLLILCFCVCACGSTAADSETGKEVETAPIKKATVEEKISEEQPGEVPQEVVPQEVAPQEMEAQADLRVHFLDVGQGLSVLVESQGKYLIYDGGDRGASSFVVSYLKQLGVEKLDYLIASHYDADHLSGLVGCLNVFSVEQVLAPSYVHDTKIYTSFMKGISEKGLRMRSPSEGEVFSFGGASFTVLSARMGAADANDYSLVIRIDNGENSFLLTGDASVSSEVAMIRSGLPLECDVLSIGHHGSASSTSWEFLGATVPKAAVVSVGRDNAYGHPDRDVLEKLENMEIDLYRSDLQGTVIATSNGQEIAWDKEPCNDYQGGDTGTAATQATPVPEEVPTPSVPLAENATSVWKSASGKKYHTIPNCGTMNPDKATQLSEEEARNGGLEPCSKCYKWGP